MEFDFTWLLWSLPLAFAAGWFASRFDLKQWRLESRSAPKAYFRGLNHLLNEQQDQAIDAFIEAVQNDPDTSELHFALGNLFRRRGDYDRAVRVHEHLLQRADISNKDLDRAQHALAMDFLKAGLLDRAETALVKLEGTAFEPEARLARLALYERTRDWPQATAVAQLLEDQHHGSFALRLAHYKCELAAEQQKLGQLPDALVTLEALVARYPQSARAWIALADIRQSLGNTEGGLTALQKLTENSPQHLPLVAHSLAQWARVCKRIDWARALLSSYQNTHVSSLDVTQALVTLSPDLNTGRQLYIQHLQQEPSLVAATLWLAGTRFGTEDEEKKIKAALERAGEPLKRYRCAACGFEARQYFWHCPGCQGWDSYPPRRIEEL
ncbi:MAG: hypothetical protein RL323_1111 [Pseudomonadota bacterium]